MQTLSFQKCLRFAALLTSLVVATPHALADEPEIQITGIEDDLADNVHAFLSLNQERCESPKWRVRKVFAQADKEIGQALRALGHYHPVIDKKLVFTEDCWQADFTVDAGPPVIISQLTLFVIGSAKTDPAFNKLLASSPLKQGDILNHGTYEAIKQNLKSLALERGYINGKFDRKILRVDPTVNKATIELVYDSGPRFYFGEIRIKQDILKPDFVNRFVRIEPDEYYSSKKLAQIYNNFAASPYFKSIELQPRFDATDNERIPVDIELYPQNKHSYTLGIGYDTNYGPLFSAGYTNRRLNRRGHSFSFELNVSPVLSTAVSRYIIPLKNPVTDNFSVGLGYKHEAPDTFNSNQFKLSLQRQKVLANGWQEIIFLDLIQEDFRSGDTDNSSILLIPGGRMQYTESNSQTRPTQGYHLNFTLAGAHRAIISDVSFVQASASAKWITAAPGYGRFIVRGDLGGTLVSNFENLPSSYRYYAGGAQSIRGYGYKELGPKNDKGDVIGGQMLSVLSLEYEKFIGDKWGVAAFVDTGNAYNTNDISLNTGVGVGVRWISPVGPVRIDFALPLDEADSSFQIHFAAGAQL
ncbi:MAG: autotransporter assembly complex protein TamA [Gammaproteobacteria bacterium]